MTTATTPIRVNEFRLVEVTIPAQTFRAVVNVTGWDESRDLSTEAATAVRETLASTEHLRFSDHDDLVLGQVTASPYLVSWLDPIDDPENPRVCGYCNAQIIANGCGCD